MSYREYTNLYKKAQQKKSDKIMLIIDVVNSKNNEEYIAQKNRIVSMMQELTKKDTFKFISNNEILFKDFDKFFILGDLFGVTITSNDDISDIKEKFKNVIKNLKKKHGITLLFHYNACYYDTDSYAEGYNKYYSGYAVRELERRKNNRDII